jgi:hypothetical protein
MKLVGFSIVSNMAVIEIFNFISLLLVTIIGLVIGWNVLGEGRTEFGGHRPSNADEDSKQVPINLGILYGTLTLVIASIVSEWPPEGQRFPTLIEEIVFFGSVFLTAIIVGRVVNLIWVLESEIEF